MEEEEETMGQAALGWATSADGRPIGAGTNNANEAQLPPPVHVGPQPIPQPMHELIERIDRAWGDIGTLISRADQLEATIRRVDRQVIMMAGTLALVLYYVTRKLPTVEVDSGP